MLRAASLLEVFTCSKDLVKSVLWQAYSDRRSACLAKDGHADLLPCAYGEDDVSHQDRVST
jgi:hypothetical protein